MPSKEDRRSVEFDKVFMNLMNEFALSHSNWARTGNSAYQSKRNDIREAIVSYVDRLLREARSDAK